MITLLIDGIFMPALFQVRESFLLPVFLTALIVGFGEQTWLVSYGMIAALGAELYLGLYPGSLILSFLLTGLVWHGLTSIVSIKPLADEPGMNPIFHIIAGMILSAVLVVLFAILNHIFYGFSDPFLTTVIMARMPLVWLSASVAMTVYLLLFSRFSRIVRTPYD